jgi:guanylate kinase
MIILTGASASGKTEVAKRLASKYGIKKAITTTSRLPRLNEHDGVDYFFVTNEEFLKRLEANHFVEHTLYNNHYYGTGKDQIDQKKCVVVDPNGLKSFIKLNDPSIVSFYFVASEANRELRMQKRGDKEEDITKRLLGDRIDFASDKIPTTDFVIDTDYQNIEEVADQVYLKYILSLKNRHLY